MNLPVETHEKVKPQKDNSVRIELTLSAEDFAELEKAKSLLSHICPNASWSEIIATLAKTYNKKKLEGRTKNLKLIESEHFEKHISESQDRSKLQVGHKNMSYRKSSRQYISFQAKRSLISNASDCCEYVSSSGQRCNSKYQLQTDHRQALALGRSNDLTNLRVLCRTHNLLAANQAGLKNPKINAKHPRYGGKNPN